MLKHFIEETHYSLGILSFTRLVRLVNMVNVSPESANSMMVLGGIVFSRWLIYRVTSSPGKDSIFCPGQDFLGKSVPS